MLPRTHCQQCCNAQLLHTTIESTRIANNMCNIVPVVTWLPQLPQSADHTLLGIRGLQAPPADHTVYTCYRRLNPHQSFQHMQHRSSSQLGRLKHPNQYRSKSCCQSCSGTVSRIQMRQSGRWLGSQYLQLLVQSAAMPAAALELLLAVSALASHQPGQAPAPATAAELPAAATMRYRHHSLSRFTVLSAYCHLHHS